MRVNTLPCGVLLSLYAHSWLLFVNSHAGYYCCHFMHTAQLLPSPASRWIVSQESEEHYLVPVLRGLIERVLDSNKKVSRAGGVKTAPPGNRAVVQTAVRVSAFLLAKTDNIWGGVVDWFEVVFFFSCMKHELNI